MRIVSPIDSEFFFLHGIKMLKMYCFFFLFFFFGGEGVINIQWNIERNRLNVESMKVLILSKYSYDVHVFL